MKLPFSLLFIISFGLLASESKFLQSEGTICAGWEFNIEPDMQITDKDLTLETARKALAWLDKNIEKEDFLYDYGKANQLKKIQGYILKVSYLNATPGNKNIALNNYCNWLKNEGFWYD